MKYGKLLIFLLVLTLTGCIFEPATVIEDDIETVIELEYTDFSQVESFESIAAYEDEIFGVYYYSENCGACISLKTILLEFADSNVINMPVYLMDAYQVTGDKSIIRGLIGEELMYTPTLLIYENGVLTRFIIGSIDVAKFIEDVATGTFPVVE